MPFKPGHAKLSNAGRKKGTPNKDKRTIAERVEALGVSPAEVLAMFAKGDWKGLGYEAKCTSRWTGNGIEYLEDVIEPQMRLKAASELLQYIAPKLKAIEHSGEVTTHDQTAVVQELTAELLRITGERCS